MKLETLSFRDKFDIPLEKRLSGVAELRYTMLYGKSQLIYDASFTYKGMIEGMAWGTFGR